MNIINQILKTWPTTPLMPVLFLGHGSPMNAIAGNDFVNNFRIIGKKIGKPAAIVCISAHWETYGTAVTAMENPRTIHDFGGFPKALYEVTYPAPGSPELADAVEEAVKPSQVIQDHQWGLDHGAWSVIKHLYPEADVPVIQLSLDRRKSPAEHYELALQLQPLRKKGVLIIGSGNMVHNLRAVDWHRLDEIDYAYDWASNANSKIKEFILADQHDALINYDKYGPDLKMAIPTPEHFLPLLYTLALKQKNEEPSLFNDQAVGGAITMTSVYIS